MPISLSLFSRTLSCRARGIWRDCCWQRRAVGSSFGGLACLICNMSWAPCRSTYGFRSMLIKPRSPVGLLACVQVRQNVHIYEDTEVGVRARTQPRAVWTHLNTYLVKHNFRNFHKGTDFSSFPSHSDNSRGIHIIFPPHFCHTDTLPFCVFPHYSSRNFFRNFKRNSELSHALGLR
jgi:hypothetical protein